MCVNCGKNASVICNSMNTSCLSNVYSNFNILNERNFKHKFSHFRVMHIEPARHFLQGSQTDREIFFFKSTKLNFIFLLLLCFLVCISLAKCH